MLVKVHHSHDQNRHPSYLVDNTVRKPIRATPASTSRKTRPSIGIPGDPSDGPEDLNGEFVPQAFALEVVVSDSLHKFGFSRIQEFNVHDGAGLSIFLNTSVAGVALIFP